MEKEPILQMGSDKMILRYVYEKPFTVRFPDRSDYFDVPTYKILHYIRSAGLLRG
jgi:hypothetical protein